MATTGLASRNSPAAGAPAGARSDDRIVRFDKVERAAHWVTAAMFITLILTGAALYVPALVGFVGRRVLVVRIHVDVGLALPLPLIVSLFGSWGRGLRADIRRLNRWTNLDRQWFSALRRPRAAGPVPVGKFNAGQKLNAAFVLGEMVVMLMTGSVMHWFNLFSGPWRTGATFVHDLFAYLLVAVVVGHIGMALAHPHALRSILTGRVTRDWARRNAPLWLEEIEPDAPGGLRGRRVDPPR